MWGYAGLFFSFSWGIFTFTYEIGRATCYAKAWRHVSVVVACCRWAQSSGENVVKKTQGLGSVEGLKAGCFRIAVVIPKLGISNAYQWFFRVILSF